jgi:hypothetical protein
MSGWTPVGSQERHQAPMPLPAAPSPRGLAALVWAVGVAGGRSGVGSGRQRGRSWVAVGDLPAYSSPAIGPLTSGFGGAPRGIRTPNRQIRSQPSPIPARPPDPSVSPFALVSGHVAGPSRTSVPACHASLGRNVVAISGHRRQTRCLATGLPRPPSLGRAPDSAALLQRASTGPLPSEGPVSGLQLGTCHVAT